MMAAWPTAADGWRDLVESTSIVGVILVGLLHAARRGLLRWDMS